MLDFLWNDILVNPVSNALIVLTNALWDNYGLGIIVFTLVIRVVTYPLTLRQLRATRAMQLMQPRMQEIQKKYKDPKRRQEEMVKVYRDAGINPLGCIWPLLVQMPIWIALYNAIRYTLGDTPEQLLDLSRRLYDWDFITASIPLNRDFLFLDLGSSALVQAAPLAIVIAVLTFFQQKLSTARMPARDDRQQTTNQTMLWMLPLVFGFFTLQVPAGLALYWLVTSVFTIITSYYYYFYRTGESISVRWLFSLDALPAPAATVAAGGSSTSGSDGSANSRGSDEPVEAEVSETADDDGGEQPVRHESAAARRRRRRRRAKR